MNPVELVILVGIQASGKSTFYSRHLADRYLHVSLDNWRGKSSVRAKERQAILEGLAQAASPDSPLHGVAIDNTNTTAVTRRRYFECAAEFRAAEGTPVRVTAYFFDEPLSACLERNERRPPDAPVGTPYFVPPNVIRAYARQLQPPSYAEGFAEISRVVVGGDGQFAVEPIPRPEH